MLLEVLFISFGLALITATLILRGVFRAQDRVFCGVCQLHVLRHKTQLHKDKGRVCEKRAFALAAGARDCYWRL